MLARAPRPPPCLLGLAPGGHCGHHRRAMADPGTRPTSGPALASLATLVGLGLALARRGILAAMAVGICALTVAGACVLGVVLRERSESAPLQHLPLLASGALAWGGGFALAFGAAVHALRRDVDGGIRQMLEARAVGLRGYVVARVGGLAAMLAIVVVGGTLVVGLFASLLAAGAAAGLGRTLQSTLASLVFGLAFAIVIAPTALAALGARTRLGGYLFLASVVVLPEVVVTALGSMLPRALADVLSIPSALASVRASLASGPVDVARFARALAALAVFTSLAIALVHVEARGVRSARGGS
jgi:hypothetical protein